MRNSKKIKLFLTVTIIIFLLGLPLIFLFNKPDTQNIRAGAAGTANLYYLPTTNSASPLKIGVKDQVKIDVMLDPAGHYVSLIKLEMIYDPSTFSANEATIFSPNLAAFPMTLDGPIIDHEAGKVSITLAISPENTSGIQAVTKIGTFTLIGENSTSSPSAVVFGENTQALSLKPEDDAITSVLSTTKPAYIEIITAPTATPTQVPPTATTVPPTATQVPTATPIPAILAGLTGSYFVNKTLSGTPTVVRIDPAVNFVWSYAAPAAGIPADNFSVRWTGFVIPQYSQTYTFYTQSDDGVRLWVNGMRLVNNWRNHPSKENKGSITLTAGQKYPITMEFYENTGNAVAQLRWSSLSTPKQIIPSSQLLSR